MKRLVFGLWSSAYVLGSRSFSLLTFSSETQIYQDIKDQRPKSKDLRLKIKDREK